jgi:PAS domain S-box-containing protein
MDLTGKVTFFNEYAQRFFGFTEEEIIGKNVVGTIVPEKESTGRDLANMIRDIGIHPEHYKINENENMRSNGERVWIAWTNNIVYDEENKVAELLCCGNDITAHRHAEKAMQETKDFLDNIIENSLDPIVIADTKGYTLVECNRFDRTWGIGLGLQTERGNDILTWNGDNRLGNILGKVRDSIC